MTPADIAATMKAKGQPMTLSRTSAGIFDPVAGATTGGVTQQWTVYGITKNYKLATVAASGGLIMGGDKQALIAADVIEPLPTDVLTIMGVDWVVISVNETSPQGVALLYSCQVRK